jgi:hypothetical protein
MTRRRKEKKRKGIPPAFALVALVGSLAYVGQSIWSVYGDDASTGLASLIGIEIPVEEDAKSGEPQAPEWRDLLDPHGSFDSEEAVRLAFSKVTDPEAVPAAPIGEVVKRAPTAWFGDDPPKLRLTLVMVSDEAQRAILDGELVGVGDEVEGAEILGIEVGAVTVRWRERELTYDLRSKVAVEFRAEYERRKLSKGSKEEEQ